MQKYTQGLLPNSFSNIWITNQERRDAANINNEELRYILRNGEDFYIPFARLTSSLKQPYYNLPKTWSSFDNPEIKLIINKNEFNLKLKRYLLSQLSATINCGRLLCPACHLRT